MHGAADKLGGKGTDLITAVKGNALPAHMPQVKRSLALIYAVNPFGADHQSSEHDPGYAPDADEESLRRLALLGSDRPAGPAQPLGREGALRADHPAVLLAARFGLGLPVRLRSGLAALRSGPPLATRSTPSTGWDTTVDELVDVGARKLTMQRCFNAREGVGRNEDKLPKKLFKPLTGGPSDGLHVTEEEMEQALDRYYAMAGWDGISGMPTMASLEKYGLAGLCGGLSRKLSTISRQRRGRRPHRPCRTSSGIPAAPGSWQNSNRRADRRRFLLLGSGPCGCAPAETTTY